MEDDISAEELSINLIPAVEQQISSPDTPFVSVNYHRLKSEGIEDEEAKMMIALCLADEVETLQKEKREFNLTRYEQMLQFLPVLPE